jgi:hypothetical protein
MANNTGQKFGGRTKGATNKDTAEIRNSFQLLIENNLKQLEQDLKDLEPKDRVKTILELAKFVIPSLKATEITDVSEQRDFTPTTIVFTRRDKKIINELEENC